MSLPHGLSPFWLQVATAPASAEAAALALTRATPHDLARPPHNADCERLARRARLNIDAALRVLEIGPYAQPVKAPSTVVAEAEPMQVVPDTPKRPRKPPPTAAAAAQRPGELDAALKAHIAALRRWACDAAHTDAPPAALRAVLSAPAAAAPLLAGATSVAMAALVRLAASHGGGLFAAALCEGPLRRLLRELAAPPARELLEALEALAAAHPRAAVSLFHAPCGAPAQETLTRSVAHLSAPLAAEALRVLCDAERWGDRDAALAEGCLKRCADEDVADALAAAVERHAAPMAKSMRFGRFLLAAVRDVPQFRAKYAHVVRATATQSKVFLAKRALKLLDE